MKSRIWPVLGALLAFGQGLQAQMVVTADPTLSPEQAAVSQALYMLRDTLMMVQSATSRFARDRGVASNLALQSRARVIAARCRATTPIIDSTQQVVASSGIPANDHAGIRPDLEKSMGELTGKLKWCTTEFERLAADSNAQELRDYGIGRGRQVDLAAQQYLLKMQRYLFAGLGVRYRPPTRNAGATPSGSGNH